MRRVAIVAAVLVAVGVAVQVVAPQPANADKVRVLILTGANNHDWRATTPCLKEILERTGRFTVEVTEAPAECGLATFAQYDVLLDNYNGPRWGEKTEQALLEYMRNGGGLVIIHAANNAFEDWPEFAVLIGGRWRSGVSGHGRQHRFVVNIKDYSHPITRGMVDFLHPDDEFYHRIEMQPDVHLLASAFSSTEERGTGQVEPVAWTVQYGRGRVFHTVLGHDVEAMEGTGFAVLVQRGTEWAATGAVTLPISAQLVRETLASDHRPLAYAAECRLVAMGAPAVPPLFDLVDDENAQVAESAARTLRWIAQRWAGSAEQSGEIIALAEGMARSDALVARRELAVTMLGLMGNAQAVPVLAGLLDDEALREGTRGALAQIPGPQATEALIGALQTGPEGFAARVASDLGARGDPAAVPALKQAAMGSSLPVALAAIRALGRIADPAALPMLSEMVSSRGGPRREAAVDAVLRIADSLLARGDSERARGLYEAMLREARAVPQQLAALAGLMQVASPASLAAVAPFLSAQEASVAAMAAAALGAIPGPEATEALVRAYYGAPYRVAATIVYLLGRRGDAAAVPVLQSAVQSPDEGVRMAGLRSMGRLGDTSALPAVRAALDADTAMLRHVAAGAYLDIAAACAGRGDAAQATAIYRDVLRRAVNENFTIRALDGIAALQAVEALPEVEPLITNQDDDISTPALAAYLAIGDGLAGQGRKEEAAALYVKAVELIGQAGLAQVAQRLGALGVEVDVASLQGFVTNWWVIGPFPSPGASAFDREFFPEQGVDLTTRCQFEGRQMAWKQVRAEGIQGVVDLIPHFEPHDNQAAYAYAEVISPSAQEVLLKIGSDDGVKCWLNGEVIHANNASRSLSIDEDVVEAALVEGTNRILLKVLNGGGDWAYALKITDRAGKPLRLESRK